MIKHLIMAAILLLIHNALEAIQCSQTILDFKMLPQYVLYNNKILYYIMYVLYRLENTKIVFEHHWSIDSKLYQPTFNYFKFYTISHFVQYIWNYGNIINYNIMHNKAVYKYLFKAFYNRINKKEYDLQIQ